MSCGSGGDQGILVSTVFLIKAKSKSNFEFKLLTGSISSISHAFSFSHAFGPLVSFTALVSTKLVSCFFRHMAEKHPHDFRSTGTYPVAALLPASVASALTAANAQDLYPPGSHSLNFEKKGVAG